MLLADYAIVFDGELRPEMVGAFAPAATEVAGGATTVLAHHVDQAGLLALIEVGHHLGLTLLQVQVGIADAE